MFSISRHTVSKRIACLTLFLLLLCSCSRARVKEWSLEVVREYPHDRSSYTQGLFFHQGELYESTGEYGSSTLRKVDLVSGKALTKLDFSKKYFAEGSVVLDGKLYVLTWLNKVAFVYDAATLEYEKAYSYPREGWGLTSDGKSLIASAGSSKLYFMDASFRQQRVIDVKMDSRSIKLLNELEWIDGRIWANVYTTDMIVIINSRNRRGGRKGGLQRTASQKAQDPGHRCAQRNCLQSPYGQDISHGQKLAETL